MITINKTPDDFILELGGGDNPNPASDIRVDVRAGNFTNFTADFEKELPVKSQEFTCVFSQFCLEHLSWRKVPLFLSECHRVLKDHGRLVLVIPDTEAQLKWIQEHPDGWDGKSAFDSMSCILYGDQDYPENTHKSYFSPKIIQTLLWIIGFGKVNVQPYGERSTDMAVMAVKEPARDVNVQEESKKMMQSVSPVVNNSILLMPVLKLSREEMYDKHYFNGGSKVGGYAGTGYQDFPCHWITFNHVMQRKPSSVLEIGCSRGPIIKRLQDAGINACGLEISKHCYMTRWCNGIVLQDICKMPWPVDINFTSFAPAMECLGNNGKFDLCFSIATLEHVPEEYIGSVIHEMARTCQRGLHGIDFGEHDDGFDKTHCFPAGTMISLDNGNSKSIEEVLVGDHVFGYSKGEKVSSMVKRLYRHQADELVQLSFSGGDLVCTLEHPIMINGKGWVKAADAQVGDELFYVTNQETDKVRLGELPEEELQGDLRGFGSGLVVSPSFCRDGTETETWSLGQDGLVGHRKGSIDRTLPQHEKGGSFEDTAQKELGCHSPYGKDLESNSERGSGKGASTIPVEFVETRGRVRCRDNRRGGICISVESRAKGETLFGNRCDGLQHGQEDDRLYPKEMWRGTECQTSKQEELPDIDAVHSEFSGISSIAGYPSDQGFFDNQEGICRNSREILEPETFQTQKLPADGGRVCTVFRMEKVLSSKRIRGMEVEVYNLETETENYIANGILVHNCTLRNKDWWTKIFEEHAPGWPVEIFNKEELERGDFPQGVLEGDGKVKLNIGSFTTCFHHGWINLDVQDLGQWAQHNNYTYLRHDVRGGLPFGTGEVSLIFSSHMLEHLTYEEGRKFLRECRRVLHPKTGAMRILVPDAALLMNSYVRLFDEFDCPKFSYELEEYGEINDQCGKSKNRAEMLYSLLHQGHASIYDREVLWQVLEEAGLGAIHTKFRETVVGEQLLKETLDMFPCLSLVLECVPK